MSSSARMRDNATSAALLTTERRSVAILWWVDAAWSQPWHVGMGLSSQLTDDVSLLRWGRAHLSGELGDVQQLYISDLKGIAVSKRQCKKEVQILTRGDGGGGGKSRVHVSREQTASCHANVRRVLSNSKLPKHIPFEWEDRRMMTRSFSRRLA